MSVALARRTAHFLSDCFDWGFAIKTVSSTGHTVLLHEVDDYNAVSEMMPLLPRKRIVAAMPAGCTGRVGGSPCRV
ncbi:protein of unknown function [Magnetospirillum sp. XM-1]|nr:protein of unknown function [Magnetospirillum sp. XM-1]